MLPKKIVFILIAIIVVFVVAGIWIGSKFLMPKDPSGPSEYTAVYLSTGDIYFGKMDWFPWPRLKNVWLLQRGVNQQNQQQLGLVPFTSAFWGPVDEISLNPKQVIFWASLRNDSEMAKALANPAALAQQAQQSPQQAMPTATSTFQGPSGPPPSSR